MQLRSDPDLSPVNSFDDVLEHLKGRCKLNLDRSIKIIDSVMEVVKRHGMEDQILMKSDPSGDSLKRIEAYAPNVDYMPIFMQEDTASEKIEKMHINLCGCRAGIRKRNCTSHSGVLSGNAEKERQNPLG